jgi:hypothetical protein
MAHDEVYLDHDTVEETLAAQLPTFFPKDPASGNYKFLSTIAERLTDLENDVKAIDRAATVQHADTRDQLEELAWLVGLQPKTGETREHFRARVIAEYQLVTCEGTVTDVLNAVSAMLGTTPEDINYTENHTSGAGDCQIGVPSSPLDAIEFTEAEFSEVVENLVPSSYRVDVLRKGTFTYLARTCYSGPYDSANGGYDPTALDSDASKGYDGLDSNGDPKGKGGTYAGLLE